MENKTIPFISILRVLSMISIVLGHWCNYRNIYTYDIGGMAVSVFLLISGYLCAKANTTDYYSWIVKRFKRILIPVIIWTVFLIAIEIPNNGLRRDFLPSLFGMNGFDMVFSWIRMDVAPEMGHTWYITVTLICYIIVALIGNSDALMSIRKNCKKYLIISLIVDFILVYLGVHLSSIIQFFIGYFFALSNVEQKNQKALKVSAFLMVMWTAIRLVTRIFIDGTILYDEIIVPWDHNIICIFTFLLGVFVCAKFEKASEKLANCSIWIKMDGLSYPIYIVHYAFLNNYYKYLENRCSKFLVDIIFVVFVVFFSIALEKISSLLLKQGNKLKTV